MVVARSVWGAAPASLPKTAMRLPATHVFVHHTVTAVTGDPYHDMREVERVGLERFGQFPYSWCVHPRDGEILEGCGTRRGAHTARWNSTAFGIGWIGNYDERAPKVQQVDATRHLIAELVAAGHLRPGADILGHLDVAATACPGAKLYGLLDVIRHPWEDNMPDDPNLPNIEGPVKYEFFRDPGTGRCIGYYLYSDETGEIHGFGPGAPFHGRSEVVE